MTVLKGIHLVDLEEVDSTSILKIYLEGISSLACLEVEEGVELGNVEGVTF